MSLPAEGNRILFVPHQSVGEVLPGAASELIVQPDGSYAITLAYNTYSIYHYSDVTKRKTLLATGVVVSLDTQVTTIPDLIGSTVPVTEDSVLAIQGYLTEAKESSESAKLSEDNASDYATIAQSAASAATVSGGIYESANDGLSGTSDGDYFSVISPDDDAYVDLYLNDGGVASYQKTYPSREVVYSNQENITELSGSKLDSDLVFFETTMDDYTVYDSIITVDSDYRICNRIVSELQGDVSLEYFETTYQFDGIMLVDPDYLMLGYADDSNSLDDEVVLMVLFETTYEQGNTSYIVDADYRIVSKQTDNDDQVTSIASEVSDLSSDVVSVTQRVNVSLNDYGLNKTHKFGEWYLRETKQRTRKLLLNESSSLTVLMIGDSWTHNNQRWSGDTGKLLQSKYGGDAPGFTGFSWGYGSLPEPSGANTNFDSDTTYVSLSGDWVANYSSENSPDICSASSSTTGDQIELTSTSRTVEYVTLYAENNSSIIEYSYDEVDWTELTLDGDYQYYELTPPSVTSDFTLYVKVVSGNCNLYGVSLTNGNDGVTIHKVGATGSRMQYWAQICTNSDWQENVKSLAPNLVTILHGTNDQTPGTITASDFKDYGQTLISSIREVLPYCDILLISPCENGRDNTIPMSEYQAVTQQLAYENSCAFLNLQNLFGDSFDQYSYDSERSWFASDLIHPQPQTGGRVIIDAIYKMVTE